MRHTGVFATDAEVKDLKVLLEAAQTTPVIAMSSAHALGQGGFSGQAWDLVKKAAHAAALAHGLPEIEGYYGCNLTTGEFVTA